MKCANFNKKECFYGLECNPKEVEECDYFEPLYEDEIDEEKETVACGACGGSGELPGDDEYPDDHECPYCNGTGEMELD